MINLGLVGPKPKPKGVGDGQQVNIPALQHFFEEATEVCNLSVLLDLHWCFLKRMPEVLISVRTTQISNFPRKTSKI